MPISIAALRAMAAAGATAELIIAAVEAQQASDEQAIINRRKKDALRQRRSRASKMSRDVRVTPRDIADGAQAVVVNGVGEPQADVAMAANGKAAEPVQKERSPKPPKEKLLTKLSSSDNLFSEEEDSGDTRARRNGHAKPDDWPKDFFEKFWRAYPRKNGKLAAQRALSRVRASGAVAFEKILIAVHAYAATADPQFTKHPQTWLNQGCWDDEHEPNREDRTASRSDGASTDPILAGMDNLFRKRFGEKPPDRHGDGKMGGAMDAAPCNGAEQRTAGSHGGSYPALALAAPGDAVSE